MGLDRQLQVARDQFAAISERAEAIALRAGDKIADRPVAGAWSVADCLGHLALSANAYVPLWRQAFAEARAKGLTADGEFRLDLWGKFLIWFLEPPVKLRFGTTQVFQPVEMRVSANALHEFRASQDRVFAIIEESKGLPLGKIKIPSAFDARVRYNVWSSFLVNAAHHRRHLWQAEQNLKLLGR